MSIQVNAQIYIKDSVGHFFPEELKAYKDELTNRPTYAHSYEINVKDASDSIFVEFRCDSLKVKNGGYYGKLVFIEKYVVSKMRTMSEVQSGVLRRDFMSDLNTSDINFSYCDTNLRSITYVNADSQGTNHYSIVVSLDGKAAIRNISSSDNRDFTQYFYDGAFLGERSGYHYYPHEQSISYPNTGSNTYVPSHKSTVFNEFLEVEKLIIQEFGLEFNY